MLNDYQPFDTNRDNNWTQDETVRHTVSRPYTSGRYNEYRMGDYATFTQNIQHDETTSNMQRAWAGARGNDAIASLQELTNLALTFDTADKNGVKDGMLSGSERSAFEHAYGIDTSRRTIIDNTETRMEYDPVVHNYPNGGNNGGTSSGDTHSGGTSSGDTHSTPPSSGGTHSGGTSGGDSHSGGGTPPSSGGSHSSGGSNSTDNGNPSDGDF